MSNELDPVVGSWYRDVDKDQTFRVVETDEDEGTITVQLVDGELEQIEEPAWFDMDLEPAEEPEDWPGAAEEADDDVESTVGWEDEEDEDEDDDWGDDESEEDLYGS